jgi:hypothetical protein
MDGIATFVAEPMNGVRKEPRVAETSAALRTDWLWGPVIELSQKHIVLDCIHILQEKGIIDLNELHGSLVTSYHLAASRVSLCGQELREEVPLEQHRIGAPAPERRSNDVRVALVKGPHEGAYKLAAQAWLVS